MEEATATLNLPPLADRLGINAQDPLSSVQHYLLCAYVLLPGVLGLRMCLRCPHCNVDSQDPFYMNDPRRQARKCQQCCQDLLGKNTKGMGGYAGLAESLALANEHQAEGTPHGHGFAVLNNIYQHGSLKDIADLIERQYGEMSGQDRSGNGPYSPPPSPKITEGGIPHNSTDLSKQFGM